MDTKRLLDMQRLYKAGWTEKSIGIKYGITMQRVSQILVKYPTSLPIRQYKSEYRIKVRVRVPEPQFDNIVYDQPESFERWEHKKFIKAIHSQVNQAVKDGTLHKAKHCEVCASATYLEGHHADYNFPMDVIWVCRKCHRSIHKYCEVITLL